MSDTRPNVILICFDQWRGDALSCAGHPVVHTPNLDALASGGMRCSNAYSATPTCIPARAGLLTGLTQESHLRVGYKDGVSWDYPMTIAQAFTDAGYQTQAIGKMHVYPQRSQVGFQNVVLHDGFLHHARAEHENLDYVDDYLPWLRRELGREADYADHGVSCNSNIARPWDKPEYTHPTNYVVSEAISFLKRRDQRKPFFLFLSFHRPHPPYDPPRWAFEQYIHRTMDAPAVGEWSSIFDRWEDPLDACGAVSRIDPELLQRARAGYYGHMTHIDHQIGRFLEEVDRHRLTENSTVCAVSDHGEMMGDHNCFRKALPYEGSASVPLILKTASAVDGPRGVVDEVVELRDVMPTLLDSAAIPVPEGVEGRSLLRLGAGEQWREYLHGEHTYHVVGDSIQWLTDGKEKYIWFSKTGQEQLFDLQNDRQELFDVSKNPDGERRVARWRARLVEVLAEREEGMSDGRALIPGRPVSPVLKERGRVREAWR